MRTLLPYALIAGTLSFSLSAQVPPKPEDLAAEMDEIANTDQIQAASKKVQDVSRAPADVTVLRSGELRALGYRTLGDALGGVLGFRTNEDHAYQGLGVRGLYLLGDQNTRVLILLDGHSLNSSAEVGSSKIGEDFGLPMELVDRIEIVRGPASSLYGNNAFAALVNVVSTEAAGSQSSAFQGAFSTGTRDFLDGWAHGAFEFKGIRSSLTLTGFQRKGTETTFPELRPEPVPAEADREERQSGYLRVQGQTWNLAAFALSRTQHLASAPYSSVIGDPANLYRNRRLGGEFRWEPRTDKVRWMLRLFGDRNEFSSVFNADPLRDPEGGASHDVEYDPDYSLGAELQARIQVGEAFAVTLGSEQQFHHYGAVSTTDGALVLGTKAKYDIGNTYAECQWDPASGLTLVGGVQFASWRPSYVDITLPDGILELEKKPMHRTTPRFSVVWSPTPRDVLKLVYGQGFRFPTLFERYYSDQATEYPNPDLQPESVDSLQFQWSRKWTPRLTSRFSGSMLRVKNAIARIPVDAGQQFMNADVDMKGSAVEAETTLRLGTTEFTGGMGWYDWRLSDATVFGQTYSTAAMDNVSSWNSVLKAIHRQGAWSFAGEARFVSGRGMEYVPGVITVAPGNWTLRASVRFESSWGWAQLSGEDLTNSRRVDLVAPEYLPITRMPADGRAAHLTLGLRF